MTKKLIEIYKQIFAIKKPLPTFKFDEMSGITSSKLIILIELFENVIYNNQIKDINHVILDFDRTFTMVEGMPYFSENMEALAYKFNVDTGIQLTPQQIVTFMMGGEERKMLMTKFINILISKDIQIIILSSNPIIAYEKSKNFVPDFIKHLDDTFAQNIAEKNITVHTTSIQQPSISTKRTSSGNNKAHNSGEVKFHNPLSKYMYIKDTLKLCTNPDPRILKKITDLLQTHEIPIYSRYNLTLLNPSTLSRRSLNAHLYNGGFQKRKNIKHRTNVKKRSIRLKSKKYTLRKLF